MKVNTSTKKFLQGALLGLPIMLGCWLGLALGHKTGYERCEEEFTAAKKEPVVVEEASSPAFCEDSGNALPEVPTISPDVQEVVDFMFGRIPSAHYVKPIWMSDWAMADTAPVYRIVFIEGGRRYTMQYREGSANGFASLDFWERPLGTRGQLTLMTYSDDGLDGIVDFGAGPEGNLYTNLFGVVKGEKNKSYWQKEYDDAIAAALRHYRAK